MNKSLTNRLDDYVFARTRSKLRLETNEVAMHKAHEEGGDLVSSASLASAFLTLGIAGSTKATAGEDEIETINGPENEPATYEAAIRSPQAREWEEAMCDTGVVV